MSCAALRDALPVYRCKCATAAKTKDTGPIISLTALRQSYRWAPTQKISLDTMAQMHVADFRSYSLFLQVAHLAHPCNFSWPRPDRQSTAFATTALSVLLEMVWHKVCPWHDTALMSRECQILSNFGFQTTTIIDEDLSGPALWSWAGTLPNGAQVKRGRRSPAACATGGSAACEP